MIVSFAMTGIAVKLGMGLVECQTGDAMVEIRWLPVAVTLGAVCLQASYAAIRFMAGLAGETTVVLTQAPVIDVVGEGGFFGVTVAEIALIPDVAVITHGVDLFGASGSCLRAGGMVAGAAPFTPMTIRTLQTEPLGVIRMIKGHLGPLLDRNTVYLFTWLAGCHLGCVGLAGRDRR